MTKILFLVSAFVVVGLFFVGANVSANGHTTIPMFTQDVTILGVNCVNNACIDACLLNEDNFQICLDFLESKNLTDAEMEVILGHTLIKCGDPICGAKLTGRNCVCGRTFTDIIKTPYCFADQGYISDDIADCRSVLEGNPPLAFALPDEGFPKSGHELIAIMRTFANWVFAIMLAISVIYITIAAFEFVLGQGDPEKMKSARQKLIYSVIGIAVALVIGGFSSILRIILGVS